MCLVLSPSHEIKVFAEGAQVLAYRHATWTLLDLQRKYELWAEAVPRGAFSGMLATDGLAVIPAEVGELAAGSTVQVLL